MVSTFDYKHKQYLATNKELFPLFGQVIPVSFRDFTLTHAPVLQRKALILHPDEKICFLIYNIYYYSDQRVYLCFKLVDVNILTKHGSYIGIWGSLFFLVHKLSAGVSAMTFKIIG